MEISNATKEDLDFILSDFLKNVEGSEFLANLHNQDYLDLAQLVEELEELNSEDFKKELTRNFKTEESTNSYYSFIRNITLTAIKHSLYNIFKEVYSEK